MRLVRVTEVMDLYFKREKINPHVLAHAAKRGTEVHDVCLSYAGGLMLGDPPAHIAGYFFSFKKWFDEEVREVLEIEPEYKDEAFGLVGHPDLIVILKNGQIAIVDIKTPISKLRTWGGQLGAYWRLAQVAGIQAERIGSLRVDKDGKLAKIHWYEHKQTDIVMFLNALSA